MPSCYNGLVAKKTLNGSTVSQTLGATASVYVNVVDMVPQKWFWEGMFGVLSVDGVSGGFGVEVVGSVGGATTVIAGVSAITGVGSKIMGTTGAASFGFPRPIYVRFQPVAGVAGFTAIVTLAGSY